MGIFSFSNIRVRLLGLLFVAVIPIFMLVLYTAAKQRVYDLAAARAKTLHLTRFAAGNVEQLIEGSRQVLHVVAEHKTVQDLDSKACSTYLGKILKNFPMYISLTVSRPNGDAFCSAIPLKKPINSADRPWFQRAVSTRSFSFGEYQIGRITGKPVVRAALPVIDKEGNLKAVVGLSINLPWFNEQLTTAIQMPENSTIMVIDRRGTVLALYPHPEKWLGKNVSEVPIIKTILTEKEGTVKAKGLEGNNRIFSYMPVKGTDNSLYISLGIPTDVAFAEANQALIRNLLWLIIITLLASTASWFGADVFIIRRMKALTRATNELSKGNLSARVNIFDQRDEIGQLGDSFNKMATALEQHINDRGQAEEALRESEEKYRSLVESTEDSIYLIDRNYKHLFMNRKHMSRLGLLDDKYLGQEYSKFHSPDETKWFVEKVNLVFTTGESIHNEHKSLRDGRYFLQTLSPVKKSDGTVIAVTVVSKDISELKSMEEKLRTLSLTDELTGLYNRRGFFTLVDKLLKVSRRQKKGIFMLYVDLDDLKVTNDTFGHQEGDSALIETANILKENYRESDIIARIGGDEFVVIPVGTTGDSIEIIIARLQKAVEVHNSTSNRSYKLSLSAGIAYYDPEHPCSIDELLVQGDKSMYEQKRHKYKF